MGSQPTKIQDDKSTKIPNEKPTEKPTESQQSKLTPSDESELTELTGFANCLQTSAIICSMLFYVNDSERSKCFDDQYLDCRKPLSPKIAAQMDEIYYADSK